MNRVTIALSFFFPLFLSFFPLFFFVEKQLMNCFEKYRCYHVYWIDINSSASEIASALYIGLSGKEDCVDNFKKRRMCSCLQIYMYIYIILNCTYGNHGTSEAPRITNCAPHLNSWHTSRFALAQKILASQII